MAKGSHATRGTYPATCSGCGAKVRVTKDHCWYETTDGVDRSWHAHCRLQYYVKSQQTTTKETTMMETTEPEPTTPEPPEPDTEDE